MLFGLGRSKHDVHLLRWLRNCVGDRLPNNMCDRTKVGVFSHQMFGLDQLVEDDLPEGVFIWVRVSVWNNVELQAYAAGKPFLIDTSPPLAGEVGVAVFHRTVASVFLHRCRLAALRETILTIAGLRS